MQYTERNSSLAARAAFWYDDSSFEKGVAAMQLVVGMLAHVDAGKTTLSEQLLLRAGAIRKAGSVDDGTAYTDSLPVEQRRGISVRTASAALPWGVASQSVEREARARLPARYSR